MALTIIGRGEFADVLDLESGIVVKAFRRMVHAGNGADPCDEDLLTVELFDAEARAYEALQQHPDLAVYAPRYFGRVDPCELVGEQETYVQGCGIKMEFVPGTAAKYVYEPIETKEALRPLLEQFAEVINPDNVWDCSFFRPGSRAEVTFVDFAAWNNMISCGPILYEQGSFTEQQRRDLRERHDCLPLESE